MTPGSRRPGDPAAQPLRSDAERNRARIIAAGRTVLGRDGLNASMASVAREAGVGIATILRHFRTKEELIAAVFADRMDAYADAVAVALADPDPWHGFAGYLEAVCGMQAADRGFADVLAMTFPAAKALEARRTEAYDGYVELVTRAKATGRLRDDFSPEDLVILLMANAGVVAATADAAPTTWRRLVALMLRSFGTSDADLPPLPQPPAPTALYRAMVQSGRRSTL